MANKFLTPAQRQELLRELRLEGKAKYSDRIKTILLLDDGETYAKISKFLFLDEGTIANYRRRYNRAFTYNCGNLPCASLGLEFYFCAENKVDSTCTGWNIGQSYVNKLNNKIQAAVYAEITYPEVLVCQTKFPTGLELGSDGVPMFDVDFTETNINSSTYNLPSGIQI